MGLARDGSTSGNGSGDIFLAFTTANPGAAGATDVSQLAVLPNERMNQLFEAVVQATETAANRIMEAAEAIGEWLREGRRDPESIEAAAEKVNAIFEACTFQDVTGQRIRRAIQHLQHVETMLTELARTARRMLKPRRLPNVSRN